MPAKKTFPSFLLALIALSGCAAPIDHPERFFDAGGTRSDATTSDSAATAHPALMVLAARCGGCHGARSPMAGLDLVSADVDARLRTARSNCGEPLIDRESPERSLFLDKLESSTPRCGVRMPIGSPLASAELEVVRSWIREVAR